MWGADAPAVSVSDTVLACARGTRDKPFAARLVSSSGELEANSSALQVAARTHQLHTVSATSFVLSRVSDDEMTWTYGAQLGRSGRPASAIRDQLIGSAPHGLCCYCQYGQATTLDHFVPKERVPALSIDPWNLVPACSRCNHKLQSLYGVTASEQMFHPYAMPALGRWLRAEVVPGEPVSVTFLAEPDPLIEENTRARIVYEFEKLGLGLLFSVVSGPDLSEMGVALTRFFPPGSQTLVRAHLQEASVAAFLVDPNSRRGALFEALANDDAYCTGGYAGDAPIVDLVA
jgi:5-methylcytosine-specific restriction endonuclease McrA